MTEMWRLTLSLPCLVSASSFCSSGFYEIRHDPTSTSACKVVILALQRGHDANATCLIWRPYCGQAFECSMSSITDMFDPVPVKRAKRSWDEQYVESLTPCVHGPTCEQGLACLPGKQHRVRMLHLICGSLLPIWTRLEFALRADKANATPVRVMRVRTVDGKRLIGIRVPSEAVDRLRGH